ncbi:MAG: SufD family Fe-S cluster assembly protein [Candidatus Kerfeldbacteria bacterium]|nr:SufD family Fe-S cluster assembly protein [Candidatus Kerfeldbacteria bacterium]
MHDTSRVLTVGEGESLTYLLPIIRGIEGGRTREIRLEGAGASVNIFGLFVGQDEATLQLDLHIVHAAPNTTSRTLFKGALDGKSRMDVNGVIHIGKTAVGADAMLEERALLLSPDASASAIPSLEINTDDVKCKHAASAGPVDPEQLFYLRSRGLAESQAEALVVRGFLDPVLRRLDTPGWRESVGQVIDELIAAHA